MNNGEKSLYTPLVLRTGFMHSYRRTLSLLLALIILEAALWALAGFWPRFTELGSVRWGLIVILTLVVLIGTRTIRDIIAGYENLFNVFDEKTEENLKLYRSMSRPSSETQVEMHQLFKDGETYSVFQDGARQIIFDKISEIITILSSIGITIVILYNSVFYEKIILRGALSRYPLWVLEILIDAFASIFITLALSLIFLTGLGYLRTISRLGASQSDLGVWNYIQYLQGTPVKDSSFLSYWRFHDYSSTIGRHFSGIAFRIVLLGVLGGILQILYNPTELSWILAAFPIALSVLILALPLNSLHRVMHDAKVAVLRELEEEYDHLTLRFVSHLSEQRHSGTTDRGKKEDEVLAVMITALRGIIEDTTHQWTWPVRPPMMWRIIATSMIPIIYFFIEELLRELGIL